MKNFYSNFVLTLAIMLMTTTGTFAQIIWNGTPVNYNTTQTITQTVNITASTTVTVASGVTVTISGVISGPNSSFTLTKAGAGKLIFTGANTYNCATAVSAGTLQVGNGTSTTATINSTSNVTLANNAILRFEPGRNMQFDRVISGTGGKVEFKGDSEGYKSLELAACNYTGTTTIESGRLTIWCGSDYSA
ncbi:MAG: autotransporter-associated beta strand repeat-containing protein, partial [Bacteroidetes bacterium]|nr:autotransporter-associated beta strand repeat-containing protein [Bacteroidota bacterium]